MASDGLTRAEYTGTGNAMEGPNLCSKEVAADISADIQCLHHRELLKLDDNSSELGTENSDHIDSIKKGSPGCNPEMLQTFILDAEHVLQDVSDGTFVSGDLLHRAMTSPESFREEDVESIDGNDMTWEQVTDDSNTEEDYVHISRKRTYSDLSTLRAASTDEGASGGSLVHSDSFILDAEVIEPEVDADGKYLPSCDSLSSDTEFMETHDPGADDFSLVSMDSLHVSLVRNNMQPLNDIGAGSTAFHFSITGADWHMASLPEKCLEMGAVNVASVTLGTVGISVIPMVSPGTIDINPFTKCIGMVPIDPIDWETWSVDSMSLPTVSGEYVNVDSITPEGVRERWHPLEERLYALGEALTALDKKLEGFSPRIQEAETLLNEVESSFSQQATHISDIMKENNALAERVLLLEERLRREQQQQQIWMNESEEEA
ncbi:hypothetical protein GDO81_016232 [Engystomops pustulosus]|uniref:Uncharacterized protein n=1 Tax=Engystomops pustulosus TaxID=76066 RepID=A0AAV7AT11_ENGPU|nr:hypothetical protein GDO81_016232 [Engystomops pustulosus]